MSAALLTLIVAPSARAAERMLAEIDATLKTPRYLSLAAEIRNNLIADYFADQSGNRAERQGAAKPPAQNP